MSIMRHPGTFPRFREDSGLAEEEAEIGFPIKARLRGEKDLPTERSDLPNIGQRSWKAHRRKQTR